ncbi:MAG: hypothetical protein LC689_22460 [Myxococcales bacterium]|nr:hypothetical protein [Myxococcales bacterium]
MKRSLCVVPLLAACAMMGSRSPKPGVAPVEYGELKAALLALNRDSAPWIVRDGARERTDLVLEWKMLEPRWRPVFRKASDTLFSRTYLLLDDATKTVRGYDEQWVVLSNGQEPAIDLSSPIHHGQLWETGLNRSVVYTDPQGTGYRLANGEMKDPVAECITALGWSMDGAFSRDAVTRSRPPPAGADEAFAMRLTNRDAAGALYVDLRSGARVLVPADYRLVPPVQSDQVAYDFGVQRAQGAFEVRVRFDRPSHTQAELADCRFRDAQRKGSCAMPDPDRKDHTAADVIRLNLAGGEGKYADEPARDELGADWGLASDPFPIRDRGFAGPYSVGQIAQIHRDGVGTYTLIRVADTLDTLRRDAGSFHLVHF